MSTERVAKLVDGQLVFPSQNEILADGTVICNFNELPIDTQLGFGYFRVIEAAQPSDGRQYREIGTMIDDSGSGARIAISLEPVPEPPVTRDVVTYSKSGLVAALDRRDLLQVLDAYMAQDARARWYFTAALVLEADHPVLVNALQTLQSAAGVSEDIINEILGESKEIK